MTLQNIDPGEAACWSCGAPGAGICASCGAPCCGDCAELAMGLVSQQAVCRRCAAVRRSTRVHRQALAARLGLVAICAAALAWALLG